MDLGKWAYGYAACVVVGVLFVVIFPIVAFCFCCCRTCCQNCGGKMEQKRSQSTGGKRCCFIITLLLTCTFLGSGMVCVYVTNERMTNMFTDIGETISTNAADIQKYASNTLDEIDFLVRDGYNFTARVISRDLDNIGVLLGGTIKDNLNAAADVDGTFDDLLALDPLLEDAITDLRAVNVSKAAVESAITSLDAAMVSVADSIDSTYAGCTGCGTQPSTADLRNGANFDPSTMPSFDTELSDLEAVYASNITALVLSGRQQFDDIVNTVDTDGASVVTSIKDMLSSFETTINDMLNDVESQLDMLDSINNITESLEDIDNFEVINGISVGFLERSRWQAGVGLTTFVLLVLTLMLSGTVLGCTACLCCGDKDVLPTERSSLGSCAGCLLMASVGFVMIFGALLMLLVFLTYAPGAPMEALLCKNVRDPEYTAFKTLLEGGDPADGPYQTVLGEKQGYTLGELLYGNYTIPLTLSGMLSDCEQDKAVWQALHLDNFVPIDELTDFDSNVDIDSEIDNNLSVNLTSIELLSATTKQEITDMSTALSSIDYTGLINSLNDATVTADFSALISALEASASSVESTDSATATNLRAHADELRRIEGDELATVSGTQQHMLSNVTALQSTAASLPGSINTLFTTLEDTETKLQTNGTGIIKTAARDYADRILNPANQYVDYVTHSLENDVGKCLPVYNLYKSVVVNTLCGSVIDSLNAVWFSLGWCLFFMIVGIIYSTKLAKHVRRMEYLHPDDHKEGNYGPKSGKVHPA